MRKIVLYIASSLDGYIATASGDVDWLFSDQDYGYTEFLATVGTVLMGRRTYDQVLGFGEYPYREQEGYVFSRTRAGEKDKNVTFVGGDITAFVRGLQITPGKTIWLVGGGEIVHEFLRMNLIDEYIISIHPLLLGEGIPLFPSPFPRISLTAKHCERFDSGLIQLVYTR